MAGAIGIERLRELLASAVEADGVSAWIDDGTLLIGQEPGRPRFVVDFDRKVLTELGPDAKAPRAASAGVVRRPGRARSAGAGAEPALRPEAGAPNLRRIDLPDLPGRRTGNFALVLEDAIHPAKSQRMLLRVALEAIERARPGTLDKLSSEKGRTKRPVARDREGLYADRRLAKYAEEIEGGWWIATNNSYPEVEKVIRRAGFHAGLPVELHRSP